MQFKGFVRFFTFALIIISLYQLHLTWVIHRHESRLLADATARANKDTSLNSEELRSRTIKRLYAEELRKHKEDIITYGLTGGISYDKAKEQELNLGLDLQGGMNVTLDVSLAEMVRNMANNPRDPILNKALDLADSKKRRVGADYSQLLFEALQEVTGKKEVDLMQFFSNFARRQTSSTPSNADILGYIRKESSEALKRTYDVLLTRIDQFGVAQPSVNLDMTKGVITVELAGNQEDPERIRKYLQATAKLQFLELHTYEFLQSPMETIEQNVRAYSEANKRKNQGQAGAKELTQIVKKERAEKDKKVAKRAKRNAKKDVKLAKAKTEKSKTEDKKISSIKDLLNKEGVEAKAGKEEKVEENKGYSVFTQILAQMRYVEQEARKQQVPLSKIPFTFRLDFKDTAEFFSLMRMPWVQESLPDDVRFLPEVTNKKSDAVTFYAVRSDGIEPARLEGDKVADAMQDFNEKGEPSIRMFMTKLGAKVWGEMTTENLGMPIAISLDDKIYSAPRVVTPILDGVSEITGSFTQQEAQDLANILKSGKLPAPAKIVQEQIVGPTLGQEAIVGGMRSFIIAFGVIMLLMFLYYNSAGTIANIALILNLLFTVGMLTALGATLTAPGIAGLVLTIGMAVDTNVIIFERIKEELKHGLGYPQAISLGYKRSLAPVLDAHVTTLLTAIILYNFGLGSIKGFATTQILGILLSLLCGILVSRQISDFQTKRKKHFQYFTKISNKIFQHSNFRFIEFRKYTYAISAVVLVLGVASLFYGFDEGVEFKGGRSYTVRFVNEPQIEALRGDLKHAFKGENPVIKTIGENKTLNITTSYLIDEHNKQADSVVEHTLFHALQKYLPNGVSFAEFSGKYKISSVTILPTISDDLKRGAVYATIFSLLAIFVYIFLRFRKWQYSLGTIVALFHDVLVTLIVFSFFRKIMPFPLEIDQHFVAAVLTVIGFSMNDTVIVFDRIREIFRLAPKGTSDTIIVNRAINETLSRTVMTALTVFLVILILFLLGGEVTRGFAFALLIGVLIGTYSSIFVAAPILIDFGKKLHKS